MKRCPECRRDYYDDTLSFCLEDGAAVVLGIPGITASDEPATAILTSSGPVSESLTHLFNSGASSAAAAVSEPEARVASPRRSMIAAAVGIVLVTVLGVGSYLYYVRAAPKQIESIAVMPFVNESSNADVESPSDGMTETLIKSLSQLPNLAVKSRSTVFFYKGKETSPKKIGEELSVEAVLLGRVCNTYDLKLNFELVNTNTQDVIWTEEYDRRQSDLVSLQSEIARDVSSKLKSKLSGADIANVEKNYTANSEAYQLYLKGKFFWNKRTGQSLKQAVGFYNQAIEKDPNYALAYSGLAETYVLFSSYDVAAGGRQHASGKSGGTAGVGDRRFLAEVAHSSRLYLSNYEWDREGLEGSIAVPSSSNQIMRPHIIGSVRTSRM